MATNPYRTWTRRWLATTHRRQVELDAILDELDRQIAELAGRVFTRLVKRLTRSNPAERSRIFDAAWEALQRKTQEIIDLAFERGLDTLRQALVDSIPDSIVLDVLNVVRSQLPPEEEQQPLQEAKPQDAKVQATLEILPELSRQELRRAFSARRDSRVTASLRDRLSSNLWTSTQKQTIQAQLVDGLTSGEKVEELTRRIRGAVGSMSWQARRIARTETRRALEMAHLDSTLQALGPMVIGLQIQAVLDDRTRPEHAARHGTIYYKRPDGTFRSRAGVRAPELPDAPNCRCTYVPVLDEPDLSPDETSKSAFDRAYEAATRDLVPDTKTLDELWDTFTPQQKRRFIGASRYDTLVEKLGSEKSISPLMAFTVEGRLAPIDELRKLDFRALVNRRNHFLNLGADLAQEELAKRVGARLDLPTSQSRLSPGEVVRHLLELGSWARNGSAGDKLRAIQEMTRRYLELRSLPGSSVAPQTLSAAIWEMLKQPKPPPPNRWIPQIVFDTADANNAVSERIAREAVRTISQIFPDLPVENVRIVIFDPSKPGRIPREASYSHFNPRNDTIFVQAHQANDSTFLHELMHLVDSKTGHHFRTYYERLYPKDEVKVVQTNPEAGWIPISIELPQNRPMAHWYTHANYGYHRGIEFPSNMASVVTEHPLVLTRFDPDLLRTFIQSVHDLQGK